ncbi:MAG: LapA family protein [Acidobacteriota bacterium]
MRFVVLLLVVVLLAALATYAVLNLDARVDVRLPGRTLENQPQIYLVLVSLGIGMLFVGILSLLDGTRLRLANRRQRREIATLQAQMPRPGIDPASRPASSRAPMPVRETGPTEHAEVEPAGSSSLTDDDPPYGM